MHIGLLCCPDDARRSAAIHANLEGLGVTCSAFPDPKGVLRTVDAAAQVFDETLAGLIIVLTPSLLDFLEDHGAIREALYGVANNARKVRLLEIEPVNSSDLPFYLSGLRRVSVEPMNLHPTLRLLVDSFASLTTESSQASSRIVYADLLSDVEPTRTIADVLEERDPQSRQLLFQLYTLEGNANKNDRSSFVCFPASLPNISLAGRVFREKFGKTLSATTTALLRKPRRDSKDKDSTLRNVENAFGIPKGSCFYVNDFLRQNSLAFTRSQKASAQQPVFYVPLPSKMRKAGSSTNEVTNHSDALVLLEDLCDEHESLIHVVVAPGGRGKTQLAKALRHRLRKTNRWPVLLSSDQYLSAIETSGGEIGDDHLYRLFQLSGSNAAGVSSGEFRQQWDQGNIVLIIDGLDEIATKASSSFDFERLRNAVDQYAMTGAGRIIITTRELFWDETSADLAANYTIVELEPFDYDRAQKFFAESFSQEYPNQSPDFVEKRVRTATETAERFFGYSLIQAERYVYVPYVLDLICQQIIKEASLDDETTPIVPKAGLAKSDWGPSEFTDFVVDTICGRESIRMGIRAVSTEDQRKIFLGLAQELEVGLLEESFRAICRSVLGASYNEEVGRFLLAHTLLEVSKRASADGRIVHFRYDFLFQHFQVRCLEDAIRCSTMPSRPLIDILAKECRFDSIFLRQLAATFRRDSNDDLILLLLELVAALRSILQQPVQGGLTRIQSAKSAVSGTFSLAVQHFYLNGNRIQTEEVARICYKLFGHAETPEKKTIDGLCVDSIDKATTSGRRIVLDFRDLTIYRSSFARFGTFWEAKVSDQTRFIDCDFAELGQPRGSSQLRSKHFDPTCRIDQEAREVLESYEESSSNLRKNCSQKLVRVFRRCLRDDGIGANVFRGTFYPQLRFKNLTFEQFVSILTSQGFVKLHGDGKQGHFDITSDRLNDVTRLCEQNIETLKTQQLIEKILATIERRA